MPKKEGVRHKRKAFNIVFSSDRHLDFAGLGEQDNFVS